MTAVGVAVFAAATAALILWFGRRDLTHPAVAFGAAWFLSVAAAQLTLTPFVHTWSTSFALIVVAGGLCFVFAALFAAGWSQARGTVGLKRSAYDPRRMLLGALALLLTGFAGRWIESHLLGGVPLLSGNIDALRARANGNGGNVAIPAYVTFLSDGFYLGGWCLLAYLWLRWRKLSRWAVLAVLLGLGVAALGALAGGSRNVLLYALAVPLIAAYASSKEMSRRASAVLVAAALTMLTVFGAVFVVRAGDTKAAGAYLNFELDRQPPEVRPLIPLYVAAAYPLETERRLVGVMPERFTPMRGGATLASLPDAAFPSGKPPFGETLGYLTHTSAATPYWTVGTYQARIIADFGTTSVLPFSILLGILFGFCYRACRNRNGLLPLTAIGIIAYYAAFMPYDNLLSFSLGVFYDVAVVAAVTFFARARYGTTTDASAG